MSSETLSHLEFLNKIDSLLQKGVVNSNHPFHQFTLGTQGQDKIELRTVVLRQWRLNRRTLIFHTDIRSPKIKQLKKNNICSALFYSKEDKIQIRINDTCCKITFRVIAK